MKAEIVVSAAIALAIPAPVPAKSVTGLVRVGQCAQTTVQTTGSRLVQRDGRLLPESGSAVILANGVYGVSYDRVPAVHATRRGDPVLACLVKLPTNCPPGDDRGRWYTVTNLRTLQSWTLPDAQHMCGGA